MSQYLLDLSLTDTHFVAFLPSIMAASAMYLSRKLTEVDDPWNSSLAYYSRYSEKDLLSCTKAYSKALLKARTCKFQVNIKCHNVTKSLNNSLGNNNSQIETSIACDLSSKS
jgi:hypothetical protein